MTKSIAAPVIVVTGGSRGIGRSIVRLAVEMGCEVAFTYHSDQDAALTVVAEAKEKGGDVLAIRANVASHSDMRDAFATVICHFGKIDGLVNNAGIIGEPRSILDADEAHLSKVFSANVFGVFYSTAEAVRHMSTQQGGNGGSIVNISSAAARHGGMPLEAHYAASKGAIDSMTLSLAKELPSHGIRINAVRPGLIATAIHDIHGGDATIRSTGSSVPLGRAGTPEEVAEVAMFLLGQSSSYMHGAIVDVTGGR